MVRRLQPWAVSIAPASHPLYAGGIRCTRLFDPLDESTTDECRRAMHVIKCRELETVVDPDTTSIKLVARWSG